MPSYGTIVATAVIAYFSTFVYCFIRNIFNARKTGFPSIVVPWDQNHIVWMIISVPLRPYLQRWLSKAIYDRISLCIYGFEFHEKLRPFEQFAGPRGNDKSFMLVTCGRSEFTTRDPEIVAQILNRPRDFFQLELTELFMARFGQNVLTSHGDSWTRQRKIVASVINERISKAVFEESVRQTQGLLGEINEAAVNGVTDTNKLFDMAKKITINVLSGAGMGASVSWKDDRTEQPEPGFKQTYIQSVKAVLDGITGPILLPQWLLLNYPSFLPWYKTMRSTGYAVEEFPLHTNNMLERERGKSRTTGGGDTRNNIMSQLLHASGQQDNSNVREGSKSPKILSDEEMMGNLFVFTGAGFDTTANTISYALVLLARFPQWQKWLLEEVDAILPPDSSEELAYITLFPKATRLLAFMLETLRLFTPLIHISKQTKAAQSIHTSTGSYWLPANTTIFIHAIGLHLDPEVWSNLNISESDKATPNDTEIFRPSRWIAPSGSQQPLFQPPKGTYIPWSIGPRVCPGQKMAQVEFVAIFLTLLRHHRIDAVPLDGETRAQVDSRLDMRMKDSISILTLQMNNVYDVSETSESGLTLRLSRRR